VLAALRQDYLQTNVDTSAEGKAEALAMFRAKYAELGARYSMEPDAR
jgi:hypothetical protein